MRYFLELAYLGKAYHGWQRQPNALSVQEVVEEALHTLLQVETPVTGAGRTDAGVHARQLFAHFDVSEELDESFLFRLNNLLPRDIAVRDIHRVRSEAHARFDAVSRSYEYHLVQQKNVFAVDQAYYLQRPLDMDKMNAAAEMLLEYKNFKCFSRSRTDVHTYDCVVQEVGWKRNTDGMIFHIKADRFLRNMVRAIVGTLLEIGTGKTEMEEMRNIIKSQSRSQAGASVPAHGLFLSKVEYPKNTFL